MCVSRCEAVLAVQCVSGKIWEFPITLVATELQVDDVIITETTELGKTSALGFRLTSTTRCVCVCVFVVVFFLITMYEGWIWVGCQFIFITDTRTGKLSA